MRKQRIKNIFFLGILGVLMFFPFQGIEEAQAGAGHNVYGWAWSSNIGWISFNNLSGGGGVNYGVNIDSSTRILSGYAWSENIGWVSFERQTSLVGCPIMPCLAWIDPACISDQCDVFGWARVCSVFQSGCSGVLDPLDPNRGGWNGWIRLAGIGYQVYVDSSVSPVEFNDWAWSDMVVGWTSFNCNNRASCGVSNYKVMTGLSFNDPPTARIACQPASCVVYRGDILTLLNQSTDPDSNNCPVPCNDDIVRSEWDIFAWGSNPDISCSNVCNYTVPTGVLAPGAYNIELYVEDTEGLSDTDVLSGGFRILRDVQASFLCSLDNALWEDCEDMSVLPELGQDIYLLDDSTPSENAVNIINWRWWVVGEALPFNEGNPNPSLRINALSTDIRLWVQDNDGRSDIVVYTIGARLPIPEWIEIRPD